MLDATKIFTLKLTAACPFTVRPAACPPEPGHGRALADCADKPWRDIGAPSRVIITVLGPQLLCVVLLGVVVAAWGQAMPLSKHSCQIGGQGVSVFVSAQRLAEVEVSCLSAAGQPLQPCLTSRLLVDHQRLLLSVPASVAWVQLVMVAQSGAVQSLWCRVQPQQQGGVHRVAWSSGQLGTPAMQTAPLQPARPNFDGKQGERAGYLNRFSGPALQHWTRAYINQQLQALQRWQRPDDVWQRRFSPYAALLLPAGYTVRQHAYWQHRQLGLARWLLCSDTRTGPALTAKIGQTTPAVAAVYLAAAHLADRRCYLLVQFMDGQPLPG